VPTTAPERHEPRLVLNTRPWVTVPCTQHRAKSSGALRLYQRLSGAECDGGAATAQRGRRSLRRSCEQLRCEQLVCAAVAALALAIPPDRSYHPGKYCRCGTWFADVVKWCGVWAWDVYETEVDS
jgi:hypothetical protein